MKVKIVVQNVGISFGCEARVKHGRRVLYTTRTCPYGMQHVAPSRGACSPDRATLGPTRYSYGPQEPERVYGATSGLLTPSEFDAVLKGPDHCTGVHVSVARTKVKAIVD
jgi:hypothetical protein